MSGISLSTSTNIHSFKFQCSAKTCVCFCTEIWMKADLKMPIKEDEAVLREAAGMASSILTSDMDLLVEKINLTLRLRARQKQHAMRSSCTPYTVPGKLGTNMKHTNSKSYCKCCAARCRCTRKTGDVADPHKLLEELLKQGTLVRECVQRLQLRSQPNTDAETHYDSENECFRVEK